MPRYGKKLFGKDFMALANSMNGTLLKAFGLAVALVGFLCGGLVAAPAEHLSNQGCPRTPAQTRRYRCAD